MTKTVHGLIKDQLLRSVKQDSLRLARQGPGRNVKEWKTGGEAKWSNPSGASSPENQEFHDFWLMQLLNQGQGSIVPV